MLSPTRDDANEPPIPDRCSIEGRKAVQAFIMEALGRNGMLAFLLTRFTFVAILEVAGHMCDVFMQHELRTLSNEATLVWRAMALHPDLYEELCCKLFGRVLPCTLTSQHSTAHSMAAPPSHTSGPQGASSGANALTPWEHVLLHRLLVLGLNPL